MEPNTLREELRHRYKVERDKRLRPDGIHQYREPTGRFSYLSEDPYTQQIERPSIESNTDVVIIGAGFAGIVAGVSIRKRGVTDIRVIDTAGDFGGVWYWNRYPGAMCDTAAMVYLPLLEDSGTIPSAKYIGGREIREHAQRLARTHHLYDGALFHTKVTRLVWDASISRWSIFTNRGDHIRARFVFIGTGPLSRPKLPGIPGLETFEGTLFHTSRWDYGATGGDENGSPMNLLGSKRVGIVGTGATAVQCIPFLAASSKELFVFQRTPSSIDVRANQPIEEAWYSSLPVGWQKSWLRNFATLQTGGFAETDLVADGWTEIASRIRDKVMSMLERGFPMDSNTLIHAYEEADDEKMEEIRKRVDSIVTNVDTANSLKPWYRQLCKRPCFHDEYLSAFNQENVQLIDTDGKGVEGVDSTGAWVNNQHFPLDVLILASGFETGTALSRRTGFDIVGKDGQNLDDYWSNGMRSLHGIYIKGFPNLFLVGHAQGANLISNITHNYVEVGAAVADVIQYALREEMRVVEVLQEAEEEWMSLMESAVGDSMLGNSECTPGYYNNEGGPLLRGEKLGSVGHPDGPMGFFSLLDQWRSDGQFRGLNFEQ